MTSTWITKIKEFLKQETVLAVSCFLAIASCFLVKPDRGYLNYFSSNIGTIIVLFCLMTVVAGLSSLGAFRYVGERLLERIRSERGIVFLLVFLCFFGSMFITNDVALITFVPFGIMILKMAGMTGRLCRIVTFMTIAANLGSMFTPMGNPQNLYLYSISGNDIYRIFKADAALYGGSSAFFVPVCFLWSRKREGLRFCRGADKTAGGSRNRLLSAAVFYLSADCKRQSSVSWPSSDYPGSCHAPGQKAL